METKDGGIFIHAARTATAADAPHEHQHYFGAISQTTNDCLQLQSRSNKAKIHVLRFTNDSHANLCIDIGSGHGAKCGLSLDLSADELQKLACALLDAAHELRTVPATCDGEVAA